MTITDLPASALRKRRRKLVRDLPPLEWVLRGSLTETYKRCGRPNCHCANGPGEAGPQSKQSRHRRLDEEPQIQSSIRASEKMIPPANDHV
jgi:hypothetical protein